MNTTLPSQPPMFLRGIEDNPKPSVYRDLIESAKSSGGDYWQIWHLLAFDPEAAHHLAALSHSLMHNEAPISPALRELIAAYTSSLNQCEFCMKAHAAVAAKLMEDEALVWSVIRDLESSRLDDKHKALLRFVRKVTLAPAFITAADTGELNAAGWATQPSSTPSRPVPCSTSTTAGSWQVASTSSATRHSSDLARAWPR